MRSKFTWIMTLLLALTINFSFAQEKEVTGVVSDATGPLPGASVVVQGTQRSTSTDIDGRFSISASQGEVLEFSYVGYQTQTIAVGASNSINVQLVEGKELETVVKDVYRTTTSRKTTSAVTTLSVEAVQDRANASVLQSLQGQVAGLNIATGSGQPGADSTIILRGVGTINGNVEPLFVVDGMPVDEDGFRSINQNDIESFQILKDAAATSIYGNRGANGVIVITTKRGRFNEKMQIRYTTQFGFTKLQPVNIEVMNSKQLLNLQKQYGEGYGSELTDAEIDAISKQTNTYWSDIFFRTGVTKSHDLAFTSGSANTNNFTGLGYFEQDGIFRNTNLKRFTVRNNFSGRSEDQKFNYALNLNVNFSRSSGADGAGSNLTFFAPFSAALRGLPYLNPYDADGSITHDGGLVAGDPNAITPEVAPIVLLNSSHMNTDIEDEVKILASFNADYNFYDNFTAGIQLGVDYSDYTYLEILHPESLLGPFQTDQRAEFGGVQQEQGTRDFRFNSLTSLNYNNTFAEDHTIDVSAFVEYNKSHYSGFNFNQFGLDPRVLGTDAAFIAGTVTEDVGEADLLRPYIPTVGSFKVQEGLFSYFLNADYDYKSKYGITATIRRDASFRFIEDNKWGTFWSVGARWNIDEESFMDNSVFNMLKLRASYGTSGNQRINNAKYSALSLTRSLYTSDAGYNNTQATYPSVFGNVDLQWEQTAQTNIGVDFGLWDNKLTGNLDVYHKKTTELFQTTPLSPVHGATNVDDNIGSMENKGLEISLKYTVFRDNDWNITVNGNTSYNKNKITELPAAYNGVFTNGGSQALIEGEAIGTFYVQRYAGVNPANGNALFYTADGNLTETISENDRINTGKSIYPVWQGGFGTLVTYKGFEFSTQWSYFADLYRNNLDYAQLVETNVIDDSSNRSPDILRAWQNPGDVTDMPRVFSSVDVFSHINGSDRFLEDASFLRLRNVTLGYTFNQKIIDKLPISGLRLYVQGENLVTFSSYRGWDAEGGFRATDRGDYPTPRIYTFGAVINF